MRGLILSILCLGLFAIAEPATASTTAEMQASTGVEVNHARRIYHRGVRFRYARYYGWGWWPRYFVRHPYFYRYYRTYYYRPYYVYRRPRRPRRPTTFGAIAYDSAKDKIGVTWGSTSRGAAESSAKSQCGTSECKNVVWVRGGCAVIYVDKKTEGVAWGYARTKGKAKSNAKKACQSAGAESCEPRAWVCSK